MYIASPPNLTNLSGLDDERLWRILELSSSADDVGYPHWDKLRHLPPPGDLTHEEWWAGIKVVRRSAFQSLELLDTDGKPFVFAVPNNAMRVLHEIDQRCAGHIAMPDVITGDSQARQHYLVNSLMEEAIRSSQLEGATSSRRIAKQMLESGRRPRDRSEQMIVNNYRALEFMRDDIGEVLTPAAVVELQRILTENTLDDPNEAGRLQRPDDERVRVIDRSDDTVLHTPPSADELPSRLEKLCSFANESNSGGHFIHPVIRAILLHFWLAYDHPFADGNGRTARALFYWYMRKSNYWLVEYLSISHILRTAPAKYARAYLLTESDGRDTTYFILYQLDVIQRAIAELEVYLARKTEEVRDVETVLQGSSEFNHRQLRTLSEAIRDPGKIYSFRSHAMSNSVTLETARSDLTDLYKRGLLTRQRIGNRFEFRPIEDLLKKLKQP